MRRVRRVLGAPIGLLIAFSTASCSRDAVAPTAPPRVPLAVVPDSPQDAVQLLRWSWVNRDTAALQQLLTRDFEFVFAENDSAVGPFRERPWGRTDDLVSNRHLFHGGGSEPPVLSLTLNLDPVLRSTDDPRPGRQNRWHRVIQTSVAMTVRTESQSYETTGRVTFFLVRGDSAATPPDAIAYPDLPDSARWWIERWGDQTVGGGGGQAGDALHPLPTRQRTWGQLKALYR